MIAIIVGIAFWLIIGLICQITWSCNKYAEGFEICNPYYAYKYHRNVNWLGALVISLFYTVLCPVTAICYWFYKLCTIGRK